MNRPKHQSQLAWNKLGDRTLILTVGTGIKYFHELNPTASFIWDLCSGELTVDEISRELSQNFGVKPEVALLDTKELITELEKQSLLTWEN